MQTATSNRLLRWLALILALLNISFDYILTGISNLPSIKTVTDQYQTLFSPAPYAFSIWGLIYISYIFYCVIQLLPSQKNNQVYGTLNIPFIIVNLLGIVWVYVFRQNFIVFSEAIIIGMLVCSISLFRISHRAVNRHGQSRWLTVPFGLLLGWLSVAVIANTAIFLVSINWTGIGITAGNWVMIVLGVALLLSIFISALNREIAYPLVIAWGSFAVWISLKDIVTMSAQVALIVAVVSLLIAVWSIIKQLKSGENTGEDSL